MPTIAIGSRLRASISRARRSARRSSPGTFLRYFLSWSSFAIRSPSLLRRRPGPGTRGRGGTDPAEPAEDQPVLFRQPDVEHRARHQDAYRQEERQEVVHHVLRELVRHREPDRRKEQQRRQDPEIRRVHEVLLLSL